MNFFFVLFLYLQDALNTIESVEQILKTVSKTKPLLPSQLVRHREIQLPDGKMGVCMCAFVLAFKTRTRINFLHSK